MTTKTRQRPGKDTKPIAGGKRATGAAASKLPPVTASTVTPECAHQWARGRDKDGRQHYRCALCEAVMNHG